MCLGEGREGRGGGGGHKQRGQVVFAGFLSVLVDQLGTLQISCRCACCPSCYGFNNLTAAANGSSYLVCRV